jgi:TolB-like protein
MTFRLRSLRTALLALALLVPAARAAAAQNTVAVLYFDYDGADEPLFVLRKGLAQMIGADLTVVEKISVVERERLQEVLAELDLQQTRRMDPASGVRVGKLLGAHYLVFGTYFQLGGALQATARVVDVETGKVLYALNALGPPDDFLTVEQKLSSGLSNFFATRLPTASATSTPGGEGAKATPGGHGGSKSTTTGGSKTAVAKAPPKPPKKLDLKTAVAYSEAQDAIDRKDKATAVAKLKDVLAKEADFPLAADQLAMLN